MSAEGAKILAKSLRLLRAFTPETPVLTSAELSRMTGLSLSAVYRFVATFRAYGLLELAGPGRLRAGVGLLELASTVLNRLEIRQVALPVLQELRDGTRTTAFLTVLRDLHAICIETVESAGAVRVCPEIGKRRPLHAGAPAKVLLAFLDAATLSRVLRSGLARVTEKTVVEPSVLDRQLRQIHTRGYAISEGEFLPGVRAVAVPIRDGHGRVEASLAVAALGANLSSAQALALVPRLRAGAACISRALSSQGTAKPASVLRSSRRAVEVRSRTTRDHP
jgi:IclR family transcriptional regulator, KDG regulon repressor